MNEALAAAEAELGGHRDAEATAKQAHGAAEAPIREKREALAALDAIGIALGVGKGNDEPPHRCPHCDGGLDITRGSTVIAVSTWKAPDTEAIEAELAKLREARIDLVRNLEKGW